MRWGYGGRRWSYNGEEGGEGELDALRMKNGEGRAQVTLTVVELATAEAAGQRRPWRSDSEAWRLRIEAHGHRLVWAAAAHARRGAVGRRAGAARRCRGVDGAGEASCRDARRAVPTVALSRGIGTACGGHAATARCHMGPARRAATDRSGPLISDFRIKIHPEGN
jgi:hypothetical protein